MTTQSPQKTTDQVILDAAEEAKAHQTFFSFGDQGLTASVGKYGHLLRLTQHFPEQKTGFCVDPRIMPEPYTTDRMDWFLYLARYESRGGVGPSLRFSYATPEHEIVHDRWPAFSWSSGDSKLRMAYVASAGTIYQKFEIFCNHGRGDDKDLRVERDILGSLLTLEPDLVIRNLDFVKKGNDFNTASGTETFDGTNLYATQFSDTDPRHITRKHKMGDTDIVLHIHVLSKDDSVEFIDLNKPNRLDEHQDSADPGRESCFGIQRRRENNTSMLEDNGQCHVLRFVLAYNLEQVSTPGVSLPTWKIFDKADILLEPRNDGKLNLSKDPIMDFIFKRNLEYILSVCSIPVPETIEHDIPAIALTCGDVEGHRVTTAASLTSIFLDHIVCLHNEKPHRVRLSGHIKWVFQTTAASAGISCPNYWTNGEEIEEWETNEWLPKKSLVDAPFQLIKVGDLHKRVKELPLGVYDAAHDVFKTWIDDLRTIDKMDFSAFPSYNAPEAGTPTQTFYFTDHALIWQAIKSAESMGFRPDVEEHERQKYSADTLQKNIIRRFTTQNPVLKKRMIATRRSPTRTRFLLRSKDTFLFRAMEEGLFDKVNLWNDTMDCQQYHEGNDDTKWEDPRRFILSIAMARHNMRINMRPEREMIQQAMSVLLKASSANGLFAGKLDGTLSPVMYDNESMRDDYCAVVFEVPYLLWKHYCSGNIKDNLKSDSKPGPGSIHDRMESICHSVDSIKKVLADVMVQQAHSTGQIYRNGYWMKYDLPFNNMIAEENIVELQDEWLYNSPSFFVDPHPDSEASSHSQKDEKNTVQYNGFVVDIPDHNSWKKKEATNYLELRCIPWPERVTAITKKGKTAEKAKKRFWAFMSKSPRGNAKCVDTVSKEEVRETLEMKQFFRGHKSCDNFFTEETETLLNLWTTEFHMSFRRPTVGSSNSPAQMVALGFRFEGDFFDRYWTCRYLEADPDEQGSGDKFVQDMIELLEPEDFGTNSMSNRGDPVDKRLKVGPWRQRRVLEFVLFGRIMERMNKYAKATFKSAKTEVNSQKEQLQKRLERLRKQRQKSIWPFRANKNEFAEGIPIDYGSFLETSRKLQNVQNDLQAMGADFVENKAKINLWQGREVDRQAERPRWTFNDESRYGTILSKLLVTNNRSIQDLERIYTRIASLSESITKELELVRSHLEIMLNDKEQRRAKDIALFTYVTAIFLPLGFATGLFSMSGAPDGETAGAMAGTAGGILVLGTMIFVLVTKKVPFGKLHDFSSPPAQSSASSETSMITGSTTEEGKAPDRRNVLRTAKTTGLLTVFPRSYSAAVGVGSLLRRGDDRDIEAGESTVNRTGLVGENMRTQSYT